MQVAEGGRNSHFLSFSHLKNTLISRFLSLSERKGGLSLIPVHPATYWLDHSQFFRKLSWKHWPAQLQLDQLSICSLLRQNATGTSGLVSFSLNNDMFLPANTAQVCSGNRREKKQWELGVRLTCVHSSVTLASLIWLSELPFLFTFLKNVLKKKVQALESYCEN